LLIIWEPKKKNIVALLDHTTFCRTTDQGNMALSPMRHSCAAKTINAHPPPMKSPMMVALDQENSAPPPKIYMLAEYKYKLVSGKCSVLLQGDTLFPMPIDEWPKHDW